VALGLVGALGAVAIYGIGAQLVVSGNITPGTLVALATLVGRVYQPLIGLTNARVDLLTSFVSLIASLKFLMHRSRLLTSLVRLT